MGWNARSAGVCRLARSYSRWVGIALIVLGLIGLVLPGVLNPARVTVDRFQSTIHLISGAILLSLAYADAGQANGVAVKIGAQVAGVVYTLIGLFGLTGDGTVVGMFPVTVPDNVIHLTVGVLGLYMGFRKTQAETPR
jgi:hypothetical protein